MPQLPKDRDRLDHTVQMKLIEIEDALMHLIEQKEGNPNV